MKFAPVNYLLLISFIIFSSSVCSQEVPTKITGTNICPRITNLTPLKERQETESISPRNTSPRNNALLAISLKKQEKSPSPEKIESPTAKRQREVHKRRAEKPRKPSISLENIKDQNKENNNKQLPLTRSEGSFFNKFLTLDIVYKSTLNLDAQLQNESIDPQERKKILDDVKDNEKLLKKEIGSLTEKEKKFLRISTKKKDKKTNISNSDPVKRKSVQVTQSLSALRGNKAHPAKLKITKSEGKKLLTNLNRFKMELQSKKPKKEPENLRNVFLQTIKEKNEEQEKKNNNNNNNN